jgi:hypothetical protein
VESLKQEKLAKEAELARIERETPKSMWLQDLTLLEAALNEDDKAFIKSEDGQLKKKKKTNEVGTVILPPPVVLTVEKEKKEKEIFKTETDLPSKRIQSSSMDIELVEDDEEILDGDDEYEEFSVKTKKIANKAPAVKESKPKAIAKSKKVTTEITINDDDSEDGGEPLTLAERLALRLGAVRIDDSKPAVKAKIEKETKSVPKEKPAAKKVTKPKAAPAKESKTKVTLAKKKIEKVVEEDDEVVIQRPKRAVKKFQIDSDEEDYSDGEESFSDFEDGESSDYSD